MGGWVDGWMGGWVSGWMGEWVDGWMKTEMCAIACNLYLMVGER